MGIKWYFSHEFGVTDVHAVYIMYILGRWILQEPSKKQTNKEKKNIRENTQQKQTCISVYFLSHTNVVFVTRRDKLFLYCCALTVLFWFKYPKRNYFIICRILNSLILYICIIFYTCSCSLNGLCNTIHMCWFHYKLLYLSYIWIFPFVCYVHVHKMTTSLLNRFILSAFLPLHQHNDILL